MSQQILTLCDNKVLELLAKVHQRLNQKFPFIQQSRQLSTEENQLLIQLGNDAINYKILVAAMAIDTYTENITEIFNEADTLLQTLSICLSCAQRMKNDLSNSTNKTQLNATFENLYNSLINMTESASLFNPNSPYLELYRSVISNEYDNLADNIYNSLKEQNNELKERLRLNDQKIIELEIKLTRILQEHEACEVVGGVQNAMKSYELREQLEKKELQIERMNEEFCFEIEKYNIVYETLKRELDQYKSVEENVNTVELIEKLQTEIVVLREEKERELMINDELRRRLQVVSEANFTGPSQNSRLGIRKRDYSSYSRPSFNLRDDQYQQQYPEDYYYEQSNELLQTEQDLQENYVRMPYNGRLSPQPNRGYAEWTQNVNAIKSSYRY